MSLFRQLKCFIKILNAQPLTVSARQNFLLGNPCLQMLQNRWVTSSKVTEPILEKNLNLEKNPDLENNPNLENPPEKRSALDEVENLDLSDYGSVLVPSYNFAAYADKSELLQNLITLGVNLFEIEKKPNVDYILTLKWENIKKYLAFLTDNGLPNEKLGNFITLNPFIFKEDLQDLQTRINYLESKKFNKYMISDILTKNPKWLSVPVRIIDERLGYLQQSFDLSGDQVRQIITACPSLGTVSKKRLMVNIFTLKEDLYLDKKAAKKLLLSEPSLLRKDPYDLVSTYDYLTKTMNVSLDLILKQAKVLTCRKFLLVERHLFLESLGRAQYNHLLPGYIALKDLIETTDQEFCEKIAKTSVKCFDEFLKTL